MVFENVGGDERLAGWYLRARIYLLSLSLQKTVLALKALGVIKLAEQPAGSGKGKRRKEQKGERGEGWEMTLKA